MNKFLLRPAALVAAALLLGACQGAASDHAGSTAQGGEFDQGFLDEISRHHAGAIAMAQLAQRQGSTDHVKTMATTLVGKQQQELQQLQAWRTAWYGPGPAPTPREKDRRDTEAMARLSGVDFDKAYISGMIKHHQEGIAMATPATHHAVHPEVKAFADKMIADQTHEIEHLQEHLKAWSGGAQ
jgi:uncharacterized protein (DUF305 family)